MNLKHKILNLITFGAYKRRKRPSRLDTYAKDLRELTLNYQSQQIKNNHKNPLNKYGNKCFKYEMESIVCDNKKKYVDFA